MVQKVPCEGTDAAGVGGKCGGNMAEFQRQSSGGKVQLVRERIPNMYIYVIDM